MKGETIEFEKFAQQRRETLWLTQLSTIGIILVGVGLLIHFKLVCVIERILAGMYIECSDIPDDNASDTTNDIASTRFLDGRCF